MWAQFIAAAAAAAAAAAHDDGGGSPFTQDENLNSSKFQTTNSYKESVQKYVIMARRPNCSIIAKLQLSIAKILVSFGSDRSVDSRIHARIRV
jgi:hypothetical protein